MTTFRIFRETTLPSPLQPYSIYIIAPASKPDFVEIYVTGATNSIIKRVIDENDVQTLINNSLSTLSSIEIVANITARNALTPTANKFVFVTDASDDSTVTAGSATYLYNFASTTWIKVTEHESQDLSFTWASLLNKPTSTVADIDDAVSKRHSHTNKTELDKIGESEGHLTYNGSLPVTAWNSVGW